MGNFWVSFCFLFPALILAMHAPISTAQLPPSETRILFQVQKLLEYPEALQGWTNWTSFCYLSPSPSLKIVCSNNSVTELTIAGNRSSPSNRPKPASGKFSVSQQTLSESFSIDSLFTVLTKLSNLKVLSVVSLGLWGPLPAKINRLKSLEVVNISSNFIYGEIPSSIASMSNLRSLVLTDNLFNGSVPDLKSLVLLQELNLGDNHLGPEFPSLSNNSLVSIILSNNSLRSEIPSKLINFAKLQQFDISSNKFLGPIPSFLFSLPSIQYLNLAENQLSGALPMNISCNDELKLVDVSHNLLIGKLPSCLASKSSNRSILFSWNCFSGGNSNYQHPYTFCHKEALAVKPPIKSKEKSRMNLGLILGIIAAVVAIAGVLGLLILVIIRRTEGRRGEDNKFDRPFADKMSVRSSPRSNIDARRVNQTMRQATLGLPPYRVFTLDEIEDVTDNFDQSNLIGEGSQGQLYKGWLRDGSVVLVKCLKLKQKLLPQSLMQHMEVLSKLRHRHLVSILGHCLVTYQDHPNTASTVFIVLEHVPNGSLRDYLKDLRKKEALKWPQRMAITIGVARGVQFLHTGIAPGIVGNNLKMENVLLDDSLSAKISSYNIPLPSKVGSESPLSGQDNHLGSEIAEKEDIYQLGVILLEVITGQLTTSASEVNELKLQLELGLAESASQLRSATDPSFQGTFAYQSLKTTVGITLNCLCKDPRKRPSIEDVLWNLQYSIQVQEGWTSSGNLGTQM
ncbi:probable LRR receptor-like serine/threonine-protein kinase At1g14390 isoform X2 [Corylus avellana]|uniref:probable LRR receptor-like serine/threonine-protein kinase At1g14390 isoform X2 n=1 Tax=Corylus avellana TaxID=13451 RepID=UPI00286AB97B|nr:probable LRR receptor-like serine/threonine-protein kinase At1g14390 isoform X2 [Corylus avellana]